MRLPRKATPSDDRDLERETGITPADHQYVTPDWVRKRERELLGPSWGKKRRPFKPL